MAMRTIQVQHLGSDDLEEWYADVIPQIGETVRIDVHQNGKQYRVVNVIRYLWSKPIYGVTIPTVVLAEIASEVHGATQNE